MAGQGAALRKLTFQQAQPVVALLDFVRQILQGSAYLFLCPGTGLHQGSTTAIHGFGHGCGWNSGMSSTRQRSLRQFHAGHRRQTLAHQVQTCQLGLHLAQTHGHGIEVFTQVFLVALALGSLGRRQQFLRKRQRPAGRMAHGKIRECRARQQYQTYEQRGKQQYMTTAQGDTLRRCQSIRDKNDMHGAPSFQPADLT